MALEPGRRFGSYEVVEPEPVLPLDGYFVGGMHSYDVSADGERFLLFKLGVASDAGQEAQVIIVQNWLEELQRLVPTE